DFGDLRQRAVDFPKKHRSGSGGAAPPAKYSIYEDDIEPLARQAFRGQRSGNAAADDERIAFQILADIKTDRMLAGSKPG
ncbi:MAG: hypothetical protein Q7U92_20610, partial [Bradyrhizobium sp.]|nr:hypothetical protein [Bradyrhizobium sp.]